MKNGLKDTYYLGWGQCINSIRIKIQSLSGFNKVKDNYNAIALVKLIQVATFNFEKHTYLYNSMNRIQ